MTTKSGVAKEDLIDVRMCRQFRAKHPKPSISALESFIPAEGYEMWHGFLDEPWTYKLRILRLAGYGDSDIAELDVRSEAFAELEELLGKAGQRADAILSLCQQLENMHDFATRREDGVIHVFGEAEGCWLVDGEQTIKEELQKYCPSINTGTVSEIVEKIRQRNLLGRDQKFTGAIDGDMLHVANGWLDMRTLALEPHSPDRLSVAKLPTPYDVKAAPSEFVRMIMQALPDPESRQQLLKVMGNLLVPDCRYEKATSFTGEGHNRKSSILFALAAPIGEENVCSVSPQEMSDDRFAAADLQHKMANLVADLKADKIRNTGRFKELVSGDLIRAQRKHGQPFQFHNSAKMIFSANMIPPSDDQTHAFFRRWLIIPFYRSFERDPTLQDRLSDEHERAGLLKLMLAGRRMLINDGGFDDTNIEKIRFLYNANASVARDFLAEKCVIDLRHDDYLTETITLQDACFAYREKKGVNKAIDRATLNRQLGEELNKLGVVNRQRGSRQNRKPHYIGIILKSELEKSQARLTG